MNDILQAQNITIKYGSDNAIISNLSVCLDRPEIISIIGPNGSGKSTLLKALSRLLPPATGAVLLNGTNLYSIPPGEVASIMAVLPQSAQAPGDMTVYDLAAYGRMPYKKMFASHSAVDKECIAEALEASGMTHMAYRRLETLSGGERQRAWVAMALAQQPRILLLDEPTTYLDIHHQLELMKLVRRLHQERNIMVIMVLHDLNHAARFSHRIIAVKEGRILTDGPVPQVFTADTLRELYGVETTVLSLEQGGSVHLVCFPHDNCLPHGA